MSIDIIFAYFSCLSFLTDFPCILYSIVKGSVNQCFIVRVSIRSFGARVLQFIGVSFKFPSLSNPQRYIRLFHIPNVWKYNISSIYSTEKSRILVIFP
jgi:hypothetical protein